MHVCQQCGCDVFTLVDKNGFKVPECMGCGSTKPPVKTGIDRENRDKKWNPDKAKDEVKYRDIAHWTAVRKEWLHEWNKRVGYSRTRTRRRN